MADEIRKVGVVGCGTMGSGISEVVARHEVDVVFIEVDDEAVRRGHERIAGSLDRLVTRDKLTAEERDAIVGRIAGTTDFAALRDCDLVIEAVPEDMPTKRQTFASIDEHVRDDAIVATNTSSLPVMDIAVHTRRPNHVLGFHFFNPAPVMKLIELVRTVVTDDAVVRRAERFAERIEKRPVVVADRAGFIANQLLFPYLNQAIGMVASGYATKEDVDAAMRFGAGHPMGPIALVDLIGLDTMQGIMDAIWDHFRETRFAPQPIIKQLVTAGYRGRKNGRGFYAYEEAGSSATVEADGPSEAVGATAIRTVGVVGTGTMAGGIAQVCARADRDVVIRGRTKERAEATIDAVSKSLRRLVDKGRLTEEDMVAVLSRLHPTDTLDQLADCDVVIEAVVEDLDVKRELFRALDVVAKPGALLATTTSSLPVIECAMATDRPEDVVGLHFFNPAEIMKLVEVVPTVRTAASVVDAARGFVSELDKAAVTCGDRAGFIVNALLFPYLNDAVKMLESHYATAEEIDTAMKLGCAHPMGPFELIDIVGLDVTLAITETLHAEFREPSFAPAPLLRHLVDAGYLGKKAGRGFHVYS